jgi:hypothetical protein
MRLTAMDTPHSKGHILERKWPLLYGIQISWWSYFQTASKGEWRKRMGIEPKQAVQQQIRQRILYQ